MIKEDYLFKCYGSSYDLPREVIKYLKGACKPVFINTENNKYNLYLLEDIEDALFNYDEVLEDSTILFFEGLTDNNVKYLKL